MKLSILSLIAGFIFYNASFSQPTTFEQLATAKSNLESIVVEFSASIPDTSMTYKKYYIRIANEYNLAKTSYDGFRGSCKDCILNNDSERKIKKCLESKKLDLKKSIEALIGLVNTSYIENYLINPKNVMPIDSVGNASIPADVVNKIVDSLISAVIKIWDQLKKYNKQRKDDLLGNLQSKDYDLSDFNELIKRGSNKK